MNETWINLDCSVYWFYLFAEPITAEVINKPHKSGLNTFPWKIKKKTE